MGVMQHGHVSARVGGWGGGMKGRPRPISCLTRSRATDAAPCGGGGEGGGGAGQDLFHASPGAEQHTHRAIMHPYGELWRAYDRLLICVLRCCWWW
jgi:hypothetical protein